MSRQRPNVPDAETNLPVISGQTAAGLAGELRLRFFARVRADASFLQPHFHVRRQVRFILSWCKFLSFGTRSSTKSGSRCEQGVSMQVRITDSYTEFPQVGQLGYVEFKGAVPVVGRYPT